VFLLYEERRVARQGGTFKQGAQAGPDLGRLLIGSGSATHNLVSVTIVRQCPLKTVQKSDLCRPVALLSSPLCRP
jgi:hypothetical protein